MYLLQGVILFTLNSLLPNSISSIFDSEFLFFLFSLLLLLFQLLALYLLELKQLPKSYQDPRVGESDAIHFGPKLFLRCPPCPLAVFWISYILGKPGSVEKLRPKSFPTVLDITSNSTEDSVSKLRLLFC